MSLIGALNIGKSALAVQQAAIQVTSNNVANAGNAEYTRQTAQVTPRGDRQIRPGLFMGTGVNLTAISRQIDEALESRIRGSLSEGASAGAREMWLGRVEAVFNELGDDDLSTQLSAFFNSWSNLANQPQDMGYRQVVIQNGESLASTLRDLSGQIGSLRSDVDQRLKLLTSDANALADRVANLNAQIINAEGGTGGTANALRDQRDAALKELSGLLEINVQDTGNGVVNVLIGSEPLVLATQNRGLSFTIKSQDGSLAAIVNNSTNHGAYAIGSGQIGALMGLRSEIGGVGGELDSLAGALIFELNRLHSAGQGLTGLTQVTASAPVDDPSAALNSPEAGLEFAPVNGSFVVHVKQTASGLVSSTLVQVDLDGLNGDDTTLDSLRAQLDGIDGIAATIAGGRLKVATESSGAEFSFSQDSSGVLAAMGINGFFTGSSASDIGVSEALRSSPSLLAAAKNGQSGDNQTALAIAALETRSLSGLGGMSLKDKYEGMINAVGVSAAGAATDAEGAQVVIETLLAQREALSGVSVDEEAINLMRYQRAFQGAARIITAVDEMLQTLLNMA